MGGGAWNTVSAQVGATMIIAKLGMITVLITIKSTYNLVSFKLSLLSAINELFLFRLEDPKESKNETPMRLHSTLNTDNANDMRSVFEEENDKYAAT